MTQQPLVVITGASSGIGQALALQYYQSGYALALWGRNISALQSWLDSTDLKRELVQLYQVDVCDKQQVLAAGQLCMQQQGVPEVVIASAGISVGIDTAIFEDLAVYERIIATNNFGMAYTFHAFVDAMRQRGGGRLVGIASVGAIRGLPGHAGYSSSKAAVVSYCESLRVELKRYAKEKQLPRLDVVTILPGFVATPLTAKNPYKMPFLLQPQDFAQRAFRAIEKGSSYAVIPWQMAIVVKLLRLLPNGLYDRLFMNRKRKPRAGETTQQ